MRRVVAADTILASNTSSLSPTALAAGLAHPERLVGLHFFNPVPAMKLVEVISGLATAPDVADAAADLATAWGKTVVRSTATPGFIVNRIARPFYAEAWRLYEEHAAVPQHIDAVLTGGGGFRMGPFALMDLIGHDVNEAVTRSVWAAFGYDPRFAPVARPAGPGRGRLARPQGRPRRLPGRRRARARPRARRRLTRRSSSSTPPAPVTASREPSPLRALLDRAGVATVSGDRDDTGAGLPGGLVELPSGALLAQCEGATATSLSAALRAPGHRRRPGPRPGHRHRHRDRRRPTGARPPPSPRPTGLLQAAGLDVYVIEDTPGLIVTRTVAMLANLAADALAGRVASEPDIDTAMRLGVNYPLGPLAWARQWGIGTVLRILDSLDELVPRRPLPAQPPAAPHRPRPARPAADPLLPRQGPPRP